MSKCTAVDGHSNKYNEYQSKCVQYLEYDHRRQHCPFWETITLSESTTLRPKTWELLVYRCLNKGVNKGVTGPLLTGADFC